MSDQFVTSIEAQIAKAGASASRTVDNHTIGDFVRAVLDVDNEADARAFYAGYLLWLEARTDRKQPVSNIAQSNIGWCYGEGMDSEHVAMWKRATGALHPVLPL